MTKTILKGILPKNLKYLSRTEYSIREFTINKIYEAKIRINSADENNDTFQTS
jgi:hypothetical protein